MAQLSVQSQPTFELSVAGSALATVTAAGSSTASSQPVFCNDLDDPMDAEINQRDTLLPPAMPSQFSQPRHSAIGTYEYLCWNV